MNSGVSAQKSTPRNNKIVGVLIDSANSYFNKRAIGDLIDAADEKGLHLVFFFWRRVGTRKDNRPLFLCL